MFQTFLRIIFYKVWDMKIMVGRPTESRVRNFSRDFEKWKCNQHKIWWVTLIRLSLFLFAFAIHNACVCQREGWEGGEFLIHKKFLRDRSCFSQLCRDAGILHHRVIPSSFPHRSSLVYLSRRALKRLKSPDRRKKIIRVECEPRTLICALIF